MSGDAVGLVAVEIHGRVFLTFDLRQAELARKAGLRMKQQKSMLTTA